MTLDALRRRGWAASGIPRVSRALRSRPGGHPKEQNTMSNTGFILTISCPDQPGIVHAVSGLLFQHGCNIVDSAQYGDEYAGRFFMRVHFTPPAAGPDRRR